MAKRGPLPDWTGGDAYLIGGGSSLRQFDFSLLEGKNTIGCNQAFLLGPRRCNICLFGDWGFWTEFHEQLERFGGHVASPYQGPLADWVCKFNRQDEGLSDSPDCIAWNNNTGAAAINLALLLGACRVFLLGYDLHAGPAPDKSHWHDKAIETPRAELYEKFANGFYQVARALPEAFPGRQVFNVTDGTSRLYSFPVCSFEFAGLSGSLVREEGSVCSARKSTWLPTVV